MNTAQTLPLCSATSPPEAVYGGPLKRILVISSSFPYPPTNGFALRVWALLRSLAANGHSIDLLCFGEADSDVRAPELRRVCSSVEIIPHAVSGVARARDFSGRLRVLFSRFPYGVARSRSREMQRRIRFRLEARLCDAVFFEETYLIANMSNLCQVPFAVDHHNSEYMLVRRFLSYERNPVVRAYGWLEALKLRAWERRASRLADVVMTCSEVDRGIFRSLAPNTPTIVAPNVIDANQYVPRQATNEKLILYAGGMDWYPNRDAVQYFALEILPLIRKSVPGVRFVIAGRNPSDDFRSLFANLSEVEFTGTVPDIREEIDKAAVCVVPLRIGSGTRLKILEAAAMGKPIVSTSIGAEGLDFKHGREIILADDAEQFARATTQLLLNAEFRERLGRAARERVQIQYSLDELRSALAKAVSELEKRHA
jgi:glycosyltransferase involved in cell wall biosynthesis